MRTHGYTLLEIVLVIALMGILASVLGPGLATALDGYDIVQTRRHVLAEALSGMDRMVKEIRLIPGSSEITSIGSTAFTFEYPAGTSISYSLSGGNLLRDSDILIGAVSSLAFSYYDETGSVTANASNVRRIGIALTVNSPGAIADLTLRTEVFLRNTGNAYANFTSP